MDAELLRALSLALGLGLLIGLQRQRTDSDIGGIRTFPLIALFGVLCGVLSREWSAIVAAAGLLGVVGLFLIANAAKLWRGEDVHGQTSEAAALVTYGVGVLLSAGYYAAGLVIGGVTAVLLHLKEPMHEFAGRLKESDVQAIMRLAIISLVILPLLPDRTFGPYDVLNPREIWLIVVLIVAIGLAGYLSYTYFGGKGSPLVGGGLGGMISSTATTVAYARRARGARNAAAVAGLAIAVAWLASVGRVIAEVLVVAPSIARAVVPPLVVLLAAMVAGCAALWVRAARAPAEMPEQHNPAELKSAVIFGAIYASVLLVSAAMRDYFGEQALYAVALVSGVVDVDAITLSTARLGAAGRVEPTLVWRAIVLASLANLLFKAGVVLALGSATLFVRTLPVVVVTIVAGGALFLWWPG